MVALRLTLYKEFSANTNSYSVDIQTLVQDDLSESDVRTGLHELVAEDLLIWRGEDIVHLTAAQMRRLSRFYREG